MGPVACGSRRRPALPRGFICQAGDLCQACMHIRQAPGGQGARLGPDMPGALDGGPTGGADVGANAAYTAEQNASFCLPASNNFMWAKTAGRLSPWTLVTAERRRHFFQAATRLRSADHVVTGRVTGHNRVVTSIVTLGLRSYMRGHSVSWRCCPCVQK
jgi:hypothetical protein